VNKLKNSDGLPKMEVKSQRIETPQESSGAKMKELNRYPIKEQLPLPRPAQQEK